MPKFKYNSARPNGLEVKFESKPARHILAGLKERGFHWDPRDGVWHMAKPKSFRIVRQEPIITDGYQYALDFLRMYAGMTIEEEKQLLTSHNDACHAAGARGMEEACGIA